MTYRDLLKQLQKLNPEQLEQNVTVYDTYDDEYTAGSTIKFCYDGVLDDGHPFIELKA